MPVVYEGMAGDPRGDLFQGLKLWISHRVPLRSKWVDLVKVSYRILGLANPTRPPSDEYHREMEVRSRSWRAMQTC